MASIREELDSFHRFAIERLSAGEPASNLDELFMEWHDTQSREEINEAIRRGLADADAGRHKSVEESFKAIRQRLRMHDR